MTDTFTELTKLVPKAAKYRKLIASVVTTTIPFIVFLLDPHTAKEIVTASGSYILVNLGVYGVSND